MHPTDSKLIEKSKKGDKNAFVVLFKRYKDKIYGYLTRYMGDYTKAQDLTIETFLSVYTNLNAYKEEGKFSSWLYKIATNCAKKELRKKKYYKEISLEDPIDEKGVAKLSEIIASDKTRPDSKASSDDLKEFVHKIISRLDKKYKDVVLLCDVENLTYEEAAKILKTNKETIHTRVRRARKMLYKLLKKYECEF